MLPRFFRPDVAVANYAESGESIKSSLGAKRFEKVFSLIQPGDYLFVQFGHNDMKDKPPTRWNLQSESEKVVARTRELAARRFWSLRWNAKPVSSTTRSPLSRRGARSGAGRKLRAN